MSAVFCDVPLIFFQGAAFPSERLEARGSGWTACAVHTLNRLELLISNMRDMEHFADATKAEIEIVFNSKALAQSSIKYMGDGVYTAEYTAPLPGETLSIAASVWGVPVPGSPFTATVRYN